MIKPIEVTKDEVVFYQVDRSWQESTGYTSFHFIRNYACMLVPQSMECHYIRHIQDGRSHRFFHCEERHQPKCREYVAFVEHNKRKAAEKRAKANEKLGKHPWAMKTCEGVRNIYFRIIGLDGFYILDLDDKKSSTKAINVASKKVNTFMRVSDESVFQDIMRFHERELEESS